MQRSAVIVPTRGSGKNREIFWSQRQYHMAFLGGFWAFSGGSVDEDDVTIPLSGRAARRAPPPSLRSDSPWQGEPRAPGTRGVGHAFYGCAARELFEEMGLWVTDRGIRHVSEDGELRQLRERILAGGSFAEALRERGESVAAERFCPVGHWVTPSWFEVPFDSEFFAVHLTAEENARFGAALGEHLLEKELIRGEWTTSAEGLSAWRAAEKFITPPIRYLLEAFEEGGDLGDVDLESGDVDMRYDAWLATGGIYVIPLRTPTIPPATHTNCVVIGDERLVIIDPGSPYEGELALLDEILGQMIEDGRQLEAVVLTHHHVDHVGGVAHLRERYDLPVWAHVRTAEHVDFAVDRQLEHEEVLELGSEQLRCVHTPGHASGHLCFVHERTMGVVAGDLVASNGTILVNPPDGHMGDYLDSLRRIRELGPRAIYPAHGWIITNPVERLEFYERHRLEREEKVYEALRRLGKPGTAADLVPDAYSDAPKAVWPIAARSAEAHLVHLVELGRAESVGTRWRVL